MLIIINTIRICFVWGEIGGRVHVKLWTFKGGEGVTKIKQMQKKGEEAQVLVILW